MFLHNQWYLAGWADDFGRDLFARTIIDQPIVFYRTTKGDVTALPDRCPHRLLPLSAGKLEGNTVQCAYHGLTVNAQGTCTRVPTSDTVPDWAHLGRYATVERDGYLWVWMGNADRADLSKVPDYSINHDPRVVMCRNSLRVGANYQLIVDNLLDLSHAEFIHGKDLGNGDFSKAPATVRTDGDRVTDFRVVRNSKPPPAFRTLLGPDVDVDVWLDVTWTPPANYYLRTGVTPCGKDIEDGAPIYSVQILTPETETTTFYHWTLCRTVHLDNAEMTEFWRQAVTSAFEDDRRVIELQQRTVGNADILGQGGHDLIADESGAAVRRVIDRLLAAERREMAAAAE